MDFPGSVIPSTDLWYGTSGPRDASVMIVGESWGKKEDEEKTNFVGNTGYELKQKLLPECGLNPATIFFTNVVPALPPWNPNARPRPSNDMGMFFSTTKEAQSHASRLEARGGLYPSPTVQDGLSRLQQQILRVRPKVIIGFGNYSLWALTDQCYSVGRRPDLPGRRVPTGITVWRGSQLYTSAAFGNTPLLPTFHPAAYLQGQYSWRFQVKHDLSSRLKKFFSGKWAAPDYRFIVRPDYGTVCAHLDFLLDRATRERFRLAVDLETRNGFIACIGLATSRLDAICIPFLCVERQEGYWTIDQEYEIIQRLRRLLTSPNCEITGQNYLYDAQYIANEWGVFSRCDFDTMIAQHLLWPGTQKALWYISSLYNQYHCYWKDEGKNWDPKVGEDQLWTYNCKDAVATWEASYEEEKLIRAFKLTEQFATQMAQFPMLLEMMLCGVPIDISERARVSKELSKQIKIHQDYLDSLIPLSVYERPKKKSHWTGSPKQQAEIFYDLLGCKIHPHLKRSCKDEAIELIGTAEPILRPITKALQELRSMRVYRNTFCRAELDPDLRMRSSIDPTGTATFRYASRKNAYGRGTNMQNFPRPDDD